MSETRLIHGFHAITAKLRRSPASFREIVFAGDRHDPRMRDLLKLADAAGVRAVAADVARLEWARRTAFHAADAAPGSP